LVDYLPCIVLPDTHTKQSGARVHDPHSGKATYQEKSKPLLEALKQWCDDNVSKTAKDAAIGKAIRYG
jgi:hypothetical protein